MAKPKECFGELANMAIRYRSQGGSYYLYKDREKLKECDQCPYFNKCMFVKYPLIGLVSLLIQSYHIHLY